MEKPLKEKEEAARVALILVEAVPISTIPSIVHTTTGTFSRTDQLSKAMESMTLQFEEIHKLEAQIGILKEQKAGSETAHEIPKN